MLNNIAFKDYKKSGDIHGTVLYPALDCTCAKKYTKRVNS
jgi:hypothetical protein